ncbi:hypothetical protein [Nostoc commune]|uniref:hypothetical protein n=1 Tax=Nostoc commune TaxID=1178 RepID=UPI0020749F47|nr:hypothetical protein [Nostoc commune]
MISSPQEAQIQVRFFENIYKSKIEKLPFLRDIDIFAEMETMESRGTPILNRS